MKADISAWSLLIFSKYEITRAQSTMLAMDKKKRKGAVGLWGKKDTCIIDRTDDIEKNTVSKISS